jgi:hypothetical protein
MSKKTETVKARFQEAIDAYKRLRDDDYVTPLEEFLNEPISKTDRDRVQRSFLRGVKTRFSPESDHSLKLAFKAASLDPQDPLDREALLRFFAAAHFPSGQKTRGRKKRWGDQRLCRLLSDFDQVKESHPSFSDSNICEYIQKRFPDRYPMTAAAIRRKLQDARNPEYNTEIDTFADIFHELVQSWLRRHGGAPSQSEITRFSRRYAISYLSKNWKRVERK